MGSAAGTRQRIIEQSRYRPRGDDFRATRILPNGAVDTFKRKGDIIIDPQGRKYEVNHDGF